MPRDWSSIEMARRGLADHIAAWKSPFDRHGGHPLLALMPSAANARDIAFATHRVGVAFYREGSRLSELRLALAALRDAGAMPPALQAEYGRPGMLDALDRDARWARFTGAAFGNLAEALEANAGAAKGRTEAVAAALTDVGRHCAAALAATDAEAYRISAGRVTP